MTTTSSLHAFVSRVSAAKRLNFADLRRLQRDILPNGAARREEVEALIALDAQLDRADQGWPSYLVGAVRDFVDGDPARGSWLAGALSSAAPKTATAIARAVVPTIDEPGDALRLLARIGPKRKPKAAACATGLAAHRISCPPPLPPEGRKGLSFTWQGIRFGAPALTVQLPQ